MTCAHMKRTSRNLALPNRTAFDPFKIYAALRPSELSPRTNHSSHTVWSCDQNSIQEALGLGLQRLLLLLHLLHQCGQGLHVPLLDAADTLLQLLALGLLHRPGLEEIP